MHMSKINKTSKKSTALEAQDKLKQQTLQMENLIDQLLENSLSRADHMDTVEITVKNFKNVLSKDEDLPGKDPSRMTGHRVSLNGRKAVASDNKLLAKQFKQSIPKTVKITVVDGETPAGQPKHIYYPIGVAFKSGSKSKGKKKTQLFQSDFENGKVYLFGKTMYLTINTKFKFEHLSKYAVIVQRDDTQIGVIDPPVINEC